VYKRQHLNNVSHLIYFEQGRVEYLNHLGIGKAIFQEESDCMFVAVDIECQYLAQVYFGDSLELGVRIGKLGNRSMDMEYYLSAKREGKDVLVATGRGACVFVSKETGKSIPIPEAYREKINDYEQLQVV
jgi:acyl-CoA thioester hydrolase